MLQKATNCNTQKDFDPVAMTGVGPNFLMVTDAIPARTMPEFLAYARAHPEGIECANSGVNSGGHIAAQMLEKLAKIKLIHIPYKGSAEVATALIGGQVKMNISVTTDTLNQYIKSGKIRMIGVATKERTSLAPSVPTIGEFVPGYALDGWFGILSPAHTPLAKREALAAAIKSALEEPATRERFAQLYMDPQFRGPKEFAGVIAESEVNFRKIVDQLGLKPE
jgi:tripartite-type tricarboxylate transporter receptor subunit TctC